MITVYNHLGMVYLQSVCCTRLEYVYAEDVSNILAHIVLIGETTNIYIYINAKTTRSIRFKTIKMYLKLKLQIL